MNGVEKEKTNEKMTVSELIEKLKEMPSDHYLLVSTFETGHPNPHAMLKDVVSGRRGIVFIWDDYKDESK